MKQPGIHTDVVIIGGGPAGSCAALRLLALGHSVAIVEKARFPRPQIGESLSPGIRNIFDYLGLNALLEAEGYLHQLPARVIWESRTATYIPAEQRDPSVMVNRGKMDQQLLQACRDNGAIVYQPARVNKLRQTAQHCRLSIRAKGQEYELRSRYLLDARGRNGAKSRDRLPTAPPTLALWAEAKIGESIRETRIEALPDAWLWGAPLTDGRFRFMAFVDAPVLQKQKPDKRLSALLDQSQLFAAAARTANLKEVQACPVISYVHQNPWSGRVVKLGEAAFALDPLSSSGVEKAMRFSLQTVIAIHTALINESEELAQPFYHSQLANTIATHCHWTSNYYARAWPGVEAAFWKTRSREWELNVNTTTSSIEAFLREASKLARVEPDAPLSPIPIGQRLQSLWQMPLRLSEQARFVPTPCVVEDQLKLQTALQHPQLSRKVAYLDGIAIAPLLESLRHPRRVSELLPLWSQQLPARKVSRILVWLWEKKVLVS